MVHSRFLEDTAEQPVPPTEAPSGTPAQQDPTATPTVPKDERWFSALGYIPFVFFLPMIMKPQSRFCQLHARQGIAVTVFFFLMTFVLLLPVIGPYIGSVLFIVEVAIIAIAMFQSLSGIPWKMPIIGALADRMPLQLLEKATSTVSGVATKTVGTVASTATKAVGTVTETATKAVDSAVAATVASPTAPEAPSAAPAAETEAAAPAKKNGKHPKK